MQNPIRIAIADDHKMFREGIEMLLENHDDLEMVVSAGDGQELMNALDTQQVDLVLLDQKMPNLNGQETLAALLAKDPEARVLILTFNSESELMVDFFRKGARGYLLKDESYDTLIEAIHKAHQGELVFPPYVRDAMLDAISSGPQTDEEEPEDSAPGPEFTAREIEVLHLIGKTDRQGIARKMGITVKAIDYHIKKLKKKTGCSSTLELVRWALVNGYQ